ncbi:hypothetical protein SHANETTE_222 [Bacillus phage Shanette]|uniref:Uncharacterized protein n=1 Tax=Bacillus phage Shanette TaxID=1296656 RepID=S5MTL7_9CAUD|nr:hypothetical protein AVV46_gp075 [Bacillus phage Shanette]AGR47147.1 hypothetical protein SHANETTE_222 [Bacillus phage Shanette]
MPQRGAEISTISHNWQQGLPSMTTEHSGGVSGAIRMQSGVGRYQRIPVA